MPAPYKFPPLAAPVGAILLLVLLLPFIDFPALVNGDAAGSYPKRLVRVDSVLGHHDPVDILGNGRPEWVAVEPDLDRIHVRHEDWTMIDQVNISGNINEEPLFVDMDHDGDMEVAVSFRRGDSLFLGIVDFLANELDTKATYFVCAGRGRSDGLGGTLEWDGRVRQIIPVPPNSRGRFVTVVQTGVSPSGRGLYLHEPGIRNPIDAVLFGGEPAVDALNEFGVLAVNSSSPPAATVTFVTGGSSNGGVAGRIDDRFPYFVSVRVAEEFATPTVFDLGQGRANASLHRFQLGDNRRDLLVLTSGGGITSAGGILYIVDHAAGLTELRAFDTRIRDVAPFAESGGQTQLLAILLGDDRLLVVAPDGSIVAQRFVGTNDGTVTRIELDDGVPAVQIDVPGRTLILDERLRTIAVNPGRRALEAWRSERVGPLYYRHRVTGQTLEPFTEVFQFEENLGWFVARYRLVFASLLLLIVGLATSTALLKHFRQRRSRELSAQSRWHALFTKPDDRTRRITVALIDNFGRETFNVDTWAEYAAMSKRQLERVVNDYTGESPAKIIWTLRANTARRLLEDPTNGLHVGEVGYSVGFKTAAHFTKKYKAVHGVSPSEHKS